jgi:tRNA threonylcarbamoyl adenosine modification protein YeaZ
VILAIDSSMGTSVAVVSLEGQVLANLQSDDPRAHAELLGVLLTNALDQAGLTPGDITGVAMGIGPGAFTGLRVGMAGAQAFALSRNLPLYPVVSHDAWGWEVDTDTVVVTDARRGEVAFSVYSPSTPLRRVRGPELSTPALVDKALGDAAALPRIVGVSIDASVLALVALHALSEGLALPDAQPMYLRAPDVTVKP